MSPLYSIKCMKCSHEIEYHFHTLEWKQEMRTHKRTCPKCGAQEWEKLVSNIAFAKLKTPFHKQD